MGTEIKKDPPPRDENLNVADRWRRQFFPCKDIGPEPPLNVEGFWRKPQHGLKIKGEK